MGKTEDTELVVVVAERGLGCARTGNATSGMFEHGRGVLDRVPSMIRGAF